MHGVKNMKFSLFYLYVVNAVNVFTINISSNVYTPRYSIYDIYQLLHVPVPRCLPQGSLCNKVV